MQTECRGLPHFQVCLMPSCADDSSGLFLVDDSKGRRAQAFALRALEQVPGSESPSPSSSGVGRGGSETGAGSNYVVQLGRSSLLLSDGRQRPILELGLGEVQLGLHSHQPGLMTTVAKVNFEAWFYNSRLKSWEPVLEPWEAHMAVEVNSHSSAIAGIQPGTKLKVGCAGVAGVGFLLASSSMSIICRSRASASSCVSPSPMLPSTHC